jgi:hypothetical protein
LPGPDQTIEPVVSRVAEASTAESDRGMITA